jgi:hypothetical protein
VLLVLPLLGILFGLVILHKAPEHPHLLLQFIIEVEIVELPEPELAVVVVEALLGNAQQLGGVLQVEPAVDGGVAMQMQIPPSLHQLDSLTDAPLLAASLLPVLLAIALHARIHPLRINSVNRIFAIPQKNHPRLEVLAVDEAILGSQFGEGGEFISVGVVDGDPMGGRRAVNGEEVVEVDEILPKVHLVVDYLRLLSLLALEHECLHTFLWIYNRLKHILIFLIPPPITTPYNPPQAKLSEMDGSGALIFPATHLNVIM